MSTVPPAGWYPDPGGTPQERWWGGVEWTHDLRAPEPQIALVSEPESFADPFPFVGFGTKEAAAWNDTDDAVRWHEPESPNTRPIWLLVFYPVFYFALQLLAVQLAAPTAVRLSAPIFVIGFIVLCVLWDKRVLQQRGLATASALWALLGAIGYIIARRIALKRDGVRHNAPGNVFVVVLIVSSAIFYGAFTEVTKAQNNAESIALLETNTAAQLLTSTQLIWTVDCPDDIDASKVGTQFTCTATAENGFTTPFVAKVTTPWQFEFVETEG